MDTAPRWYARYGKRLFDLVAACALLIPLAPVLAGLALLVWCWHGRPVVFCQSRPGKGGRVFRIYKFRTMTDARDACGNLLPDAQRLTRFGIWLRSTSLDELPELWNILRGDMSFVGPRPLLERYLTLYSPEQARRHDVRPGLTGWAQIHGRNATTWDERLAQDVWYVRHLSFGLDLYILWATVGKVLKRDGISADNAATMPEFTGSSSPAEMLSACERHTARGVIVIGGGGHAAVVISALRAAGHSVAGVYDDDRQLSGQSILGAPVLGSIANIAPDPEQPAVLGIGSNDVRRRLAERLSLQWITVVHPRAWVADEVVIGTGSVVMAGAVIQPRSTIGRHAIINTSASVDHDCELGDFVHLAPGVHLAGNVQVGMGSFVGMGACVIPGKQIGGETTIGAGATVLEDIPNRVVAVGCPARVIRTTEELRRAA